MPGYAVPAVLPPVDPAVMRMALTGRPMTPAEYREAEKQSFFWRTPGLLLLGFLLFLLGMLAFSLSAVNTDADPAAGTLGPTLAALLAAGAAVAGLSIGRWVKRNRRIDQRYRVYCMNHREPVLLEVYDDRFVEIGKHGVSVYRFSQITLLTMEPQMITIFADGGRLVFRAGDLTPFDAALLTAYIRGRVADRVIREKAPVVGLLSRPLDLPRFQPSGEPVASAAISVWQRPFSQSLKRVAGTFPLWLSWGLVPGALLANLMYMTDWIWADIVLFAAAAGGIGFLIALLLTLLIGQGAKSFLTLQFAPDGVVVISGERRTFLARESLQWTDAGGGLVIRAAEEMLWVPWTAVDRPQALKSALVL